MGKKVASFVAGAAVVGLSWGLWSAGQPPREVEPHQPMTVRVTEYKEKQVVSHAPTKECKVYLEAVTDLREGQAEMSKTHGQMKNMITRIEDNLMTKDAKEVVAMQREMYALQTKADDAWLVIGTASATLDQYEPGQSPCD